MSIRYLYNTSGKYVAFISGDNVFSPNTDWIGFLREGNRFFWKDGRFAGYVMDDDRVFKNQQEFERYPIYPPFQPFRPFKPFDPFPRLPKFPPPYPYLDIFEKRQ